MFSVAAQTELAGVEKSLVWEQAPKEKFEALETTPRETQKNLIKGPR
jgi:hypothetical protein